MQTNTVNTLLFCLVSYRYMMLRLLFTSIALRYARSTMFDTRLCTQRCKTLTQSRFALIVKRFALYNRMQSELCLQRPLRKDMTIAR